jgi:hypothetical protein
MTLTHTNSSEHNSWEDSAASPNQKNSLHIVGTEISLLAQKIQPWSTTFVRRYHSVASRLRVSLQVALFFRCSHKNQHAISYLDTYNMLHFSYGPWCGHPVNIGNE